MRFLILFLFVFLCACEQEVSLDIDFGEQKAVLNCILDPNEEILVSLTQSANINDTGDFQIIDNARVLLFENMQFVDSLKTNPDGNFYSSIKPKPGKFYTLKALLADNKELTASDTIPLIPKVDSFYCIQNNIGRLKLMLSFKDSLALKNYYKIEVFEIRENNAEFKIGFRFEDESMRLFSLLDTSFVFRDIEFKQASIRLNIICDAPKAKSIHVKFSSLSESFFKYITFANQNYLANSGSEYARVPNYSNVSNNIGILGAKSDVDLYTNVK